MLCGFAAFVVLAATLDRRLLLASLWVSSLTLVFYYVGLEGPYDLFLPIAQFTGAISYATVSASVAAWQSEISVVRTAITIAVFVVLAYALARSFRGLVPSRRTKA